MLSRDNQALSGVSLTVKDHPEFGQTLSRGDGEFDMAVNAGGLLTINYEKPGFLPVQRQVQTPWQDYVVAEDVIMLSLDPQVTAIDLSSAAMQVAQGSMSTNADGPRQATVLFPQGTEATMTLPDGSTQPLTNLHVRATEYTVGESGPKAMPGALPPTQVTPTRSSSRLMRRSRRGSGVSISTGPCRSRQLPGLPGRWHRARRLV